METDPGEYFINWDGLSDLGSPLEPGDYSFVIRAVNADDQLIQTESLIKGRVEAVDMSGVATQLETSSGVFAMNKIEKAGAAL